MIILTREQAEQLLRHAEQCWHTRDLDALGALVTADVRIRINDDPAIHGGAAARDWFAARLDRQRDYRLRKTLRGLDGDTVVSHWTGRWIDGGTGEPWTCRGIELLRIRENRVYDWEAAVHSTVVSSTAVHSTVVSSTAKGTDT